MEKTEMLALKKGFSMSQKHLLICKNKVLQKKYGKWQGHK
jgi:hypothetical protein